MFYTYFMSYFDIIIVWSNGDKNHESYTFLLLLRKLWLPHE